MTGPLKHFIGCVTAALAAAWAIGGYTCLAQEVRVRVIDVKSGRAVSGKRVRVDFQYNYPEVRQGPVLRAGADGVVALHLNPPLPKSLIVELTIGNWVQCSSGLVQLSPVLDSGVVDENHCKPGPDQKQTYTANPGEIVVFTRHISRWERLREFPR